LDLKPANILLDEFKRAKIADFGMSKVVISKRDFSMKADVAGGGTPIYMAPELLQDATKFSTKCDVYSYGIMAWEAIENKTPFEGHTQNLQALKDFVCGQKGRPIPDSQIDKEKLNPLFRFYKKCWDEKPSERFSFADLANDLTSPPWSEILAMWQTNDTRNIQIWTAAVKQSGTGTNEAVKFEHFFDSYCETLQTRNLFNLRTPEPLTLAIAAILDIDTNKGNLGEQIVKKDDWERLFRWFAPLSQKTAAMVHQLITKKWFFGKMDQFQANNNLMFEKAGTFLVRFSASEVGKFTVSFVGKVGKGTQIIHTRLEGSVASAQNLVSYIESQRKYFKYEYTGTRPYANVPPLQ